MTDLAEFVPLMNMNIEANNETFDMFVEAKELKWGSDVTCDDRYQDLDVVIAADCIYYEEVRLDSSYQ